MVSNSIKRVKVRTSKAAYVEWQTHVFEVDLVGARSDRVVLATVKSFFGSRGVVAEHMRGDSDNKGVEREVRGDQEPPRSRWSRRGGCGAVRARHRAGRAAPLCRQVRRGRSRADRKSTRLNSSH